MLDRRTFLATAAAVMAHPVMARAAATPPVFWGPPAAPSLVLAHAVASETMRGFTASATFRTAQTADEMRAGLNSGSMKAAILPTHVAADLYNHGADVRLLNVMTQGLLYVVAGPGIGDLGDLAGRRLAIPYQNGMPDVVLCRLLAKADLRSGRDFELKYAGKPSQAVKMLIANEVDGVLLAEPAATAAILQAKAAGKSVSRAIDCQDAWAEITGNSSFLPQAGLVVTGAFSDELGKLGRAMLQQALRESVEFVLDFPMRAARTTTADFGMTSLVVAQAINHSNLVAMPAASVRPELEAFFSTLAQENHRMIGGKLPDGGFYLS